jgi:hypothetical protein
VSWKCEIQIAVRFFDGFMATVAPGRLLSHLSPQRKTFEEGRGRNVTTLSIAGDSSGHRS